MPDEIFRIESRRVERAKRMQTAQHFIAAIMLITNGWTHLTAHESHHTALAVFEVVGGALLIGAVIFEKVRHSRGAHSNIGWVEIAGAAMLTVEAINKLVEPHTVALRIVSFIPPILLLLFGIFDVKMRELAQIRATDDELTMRVRFLFRKRVKWSDVRSARAAGEKLVIDHHDGTTREISMRDIKNRAEAMPWVMEQFRRRGLAAE
jgi:hypothetical protein